MADLPPFKMIGRLFTYMVTLWRQPHWWAEAWSSFGMVLWGGIALLGRALDDRVSFDGLTKYMPGVAWGSLALTIGMLQASALVTNRKWLRVIAALLCGWFFSYVMVSFIGGGDVPPGMALYVVLVGINVMAMYKIVIRGTG